MKEKLKDLGLLIKRDRRAQTIAILLGFAGLYLATADNKVHRGQPRQPQQVAEEIQPTGPASDEQFQDLMLRMSSDISAIQQDSQRHGEEIKAIQANMDKNVEQTAEIFKKLLERVTEVEANGGKGGARGGYAPTDVGAEDGTLDPAAVGGGGTGQPVASDELQSFGLETPEIAPAPTAAPRHVAFIGAGDSVRIKLLAGVNAPTDGSPYPVVFKLASDVNGPDGSALPLGEARLIAAAQGSLTDSRALFRLTSLNVRLPNGRRKVIEVDGWVVGEDGIRGMQGILIDPIGKVIGAAGMTGALQGIGEGLSQSQLETDRGGYGQSTTVLSGDVGTYAAGLGAAGAANQWSSIIKDRARQLVPQVQVMSGREATAIFARSVSIPDLFESMDDEDPGTSTLD